MSSPESQSPQSSNDSPSTIKTWVCPACLKDFHTSSGRSVHMRRHHDHRSPCTSCMLLKCILPICPVRKHCHGGAHGGPARPTPASDCPAPTPTSAPTPAPEWQVELVAIAGGLSAFDQDEFEDDLMAMNDGQPIPAGDVWPRPW